MNRRVVVQLFATLLVAMLLISACVPVAQAPAAGDAGAASTDNAAGGGELVIWNTGGENDAKALQTVADLFTKANPDVTVKIEAIPWSDAHAKVLAAVAAGTGPDIITGGMSWGIEFGKLGGMVDLKDVYPEMTEEIVKMMPPQVAAAIIPPSGEVYGVQWDVTLMAMFYRTDLLQELTGLEAAPANWGEFSDALAKIQEAGKKGYQQDWGNTDWLGLFSFIYSAGGSYYDTECTQATINSPAAVEALEFYASLYTKFNAPTDSVDIGQGLESGDYPLAIGGSWNAAGLEFSRPAIAGQWAMAPLPKGPGDKAISFLGGRIIGILSSSQQPDVAAEFIHSLYTPEAVGVQADFWKQQNGFFIPPSAELVSAAKLPEGIAGALNSILLEAAGPPNCPGWEESQADVTKFVQEVIFNGADAQEMLDQAADLMNKNLTQQ